MSTNLLLTLLVGALFAAGIYLILERALTRILVGVMLISHGVNALFLVSSGPAGLAPLLGRNDPDQISDPLPQALVLTAIVITLGATAFVLAMAYRSWQLNRHDDVQDDVEDALIRRLAEMDEASTSYDDSAGGTLDEEGRDNPEGVGMSGPSAAGPSPAGPPSGQPPEPGERGRQ